MATTSTARHGPAPSAHAMADALGWFSIGLGLGELLAPRALARFLGLDDHVALIRAYGARELATGIGILSQDDPTPWLRARVAGDALDLATLAAGLAEEGARKDNIGLAVAAVAGVTVLDVICAQALADSRARSDHRVVDYRDRRGMPRPPDAMRGVARDAPIPRDMRIPEALRPYQTPAEPRAEPTAGRGGTSGSPGQTAHAEATAAVTGAKIDVASSGAGGEVSQGVGGT